MSNNIPSSTNKLGEYIKGYVKRENITMLLHKIPDFSDSLSEIIDNKSYFSHHTNTPDYIKEGPLRECVTLHLIDQQLANSNCDKFPKTLLLLDRLVRIIESPKNKIVRKAYVTCLPSKKQIYVHSDTHSDISDSYWDDIIRYQFYYTGDDSMIQKIDNTVYPMGPGYLFISLTTDNCTHIKTIVQVIYY